MRAVNIVVESKGRNPSAADLIVGKVYAAVRYEPGEEDEQGNPDTRHLVYYVVYNEVGDRCGIYRDFLGVRITELYNGPALA